MLVRVLLIAAMLTSCKGRGADVCAGFDDADTCKNNRECDWYVPGCGEPALEDEGCYQRVTCGQAPGCPDGLTCTTVIVDPCADGKCLACGAEADVCLP